MNVRRRNVRVATQKLKVRCLAYILKRESGYGRRFDSTNVKAICGRLPFIWEGRGFSLNGLDKVFASQWLSNDQVILGSKCNHLALLNCLTRELQLIPLLEETGTICNPEVKCASGIHAIQLNPSQTFLATGGKNITTVGVYSLPELSPFCIFQKHHKNCVFDIRWLDDACLASCSRDSSLALWRLPCPEKVSSQPERLSSSFIGRMSPSVDYQAISTPMASVVSELPDDRFRALEYLPSRNMFALVSMSRHFYLYDAERLFGGDSQRPFHTIFLRYSDREAVALRRWPLNNNVVAVATHRSVLLFDIRCPSKIRNTSARCIYPPFSSFSSCVRSLNFSGNLVSYGTSAGKVHFYDLAADKHLPTHLDVESKTRQSNPTCEISGFPPSEVDDLPDLASDFGPSTRSSSSIAQEELQEDVAEQMFRPPYLSNSYFSTPEEGEGTSTVQPHLRGRIRFAASPTSPESSVIDLGSMSLLGSISQTRVGLERLRIRLAQLRQTTAALRIQRALLYSVATNSDFMRNTHSDTTPSTTAVEEGSGEVEDFVAQSEEPPLSATARTRMVFSSEEATRALFSRSLGLSTPGTNTAVYTHEYDPSGTRLFTAGGPIGSAFSGSFAVVWD
nr:unnamed protein product [Spirometra erinaceieuropaei]